jgi:hypothetical protein
MPRTRTGVALALSALLSGCGDSDAAAGGGGSAGCSGCGGSPEGGSAGASGSAGVGGSAGCAGCGGGAGAGGLAPGCVDITVNADVLDDAAAWLRRVHPVPGGLWATAQGIHYSWIAYRFFPEGTSGQYLEETVPWLIVSTFESETGAVTRHDRYKMFPDGFSYSTAVIRSFAGRADGTFSVGHERVENGEHPERVALGHFGDPDLYQSLLVATAGDPSLVSSQTAAAWDGEAFALHAYGAPPQFTLHVARVDDLGNVVLPFTEYGITSNAAPSVLGHATATSAESGRTYVFDAAGDNLLNGHLRDGTRLPGTEFGPKLVKANGTVTTFSAIGTVSADQAGAWVAWTQINVTKPERYEIVVQRLDADGSSIGDAAVLPIGPLDDPGGVEAWRLLARGSSVVIFTSSSSAVYRNDYDGVELGPPERILEGGANVELDIRAMEAIEHDGDVWLSYAQYKGPSYLRVIKAAPGCVYPAEPSSIP